MLSSNVLFILFMGNDYSTSLSKKIARTIHYVTIMMKIFVYKNLLDFAMKYTIHVIYPNIQSAKTSKLPAETERKFMVFNIKI